MLFKRLAGVVTVKAGRVVQSFQYSRYLPVGSVQAVCQNLDRWGVDEIFIQCIDRSKDNFGPDLDLVSEFSKFGQTPIVYGGGIRNVDDAVNVIRSGADRIMVDSLVHDNPGELKNIARELGLQAIVASLPLKMADGSPVSYDYRKKTVVDTLANAELYLRKYVSELLIIDVLGDGGSAFNQVLVEGLPEGLAQMSHILFGGIKADRVTDLLSKRNIECVAIGNALNYTEHAAQNVRQVCQHHLLRSAAYERGEA